MEIERKFLVRQLPDLSGFRMLQIEQAYLNRDPVVRVRQENDTFYLTYKGRGLIAREEYNLPLGEAGYAHLKEKADGNIITKKRYLIPTGPYMAELDVFEGAFEGLVFVEVEFESLDQAERFAAPAWFGKDVTTAGYYQNSALSAMAPEEIPALIARARLEAAEMSDGE